MPMSVTSRWAFERGEVLLRYRWLWDDLYAYFVPIPYPYGQNSRYSKKGILPEMGWAYPTTLPSTPDQSAIKAGKWGQAIWGDPSGTYACRAKFTTPFAPGPTALKTGTRFTFWAAAQQDTYNGYTLGQRPLISLQDSPSDNDISLCSVNSALGGVSYRFAWRIYGSGAWSDAYPGVRTTATEQQKSFTFGGTLDGTAMKVYWNGALEGTGTFSGTRGSTASQMIGVGGHADVTSHPYDFDGGIYVAAIWLTPLRPAAISLLACEPFAPFQRRRIFGAVVPGVNVRLLENGTERAKRRVPLSKFAGQITFPNVQTGAALATLQDNFDDGIIHPNWTTTLNGGTAVESNGVLTLRNESDTTQVASTVTLNGTSSQVVVRIIYHPGGTTRTRLTIADSGGDGFQIELYAGNVYYDDIAAWTAGGGGWAGVNHAYDSNTHAWFRIREASGTYYFDTAEIGKSDPPNETDWTNRASRVYAAVDVTALNVYLISRYTYTNGPGSIFGAVNTTTLGTRPRRLTLDLTTAERDAITDWSTLQFEVGAPSKGTFQLHKMYLQAPTGAGTVPIPFTKVFLYYVGPNNYVDFTAEAASLTPGDMSGPGWS